MNREILIDALEELDSGLIERYFEIKEKLRKRRRVKNNVISWSVVAACVVSMLSGVFIVFKEHNAPSVDIKIEEYPIYYFDETADIISIVPEGVRYVNEYGSICHMGFDEDSLRLYFVKTTNDRIDISLKGCANSKGIPSEWVMATTSDERSDDFIYDEGLLLITINGVETDRIPDAIGEYEIIINFYKMHQICEYIDHIKISGFCYFESHSLLIEETD